MSVGLFWPQRINLTGWLFDGWMAVSIDQNFLEYSWVPVREQY